MTTPTEYLEWYKELSKECDSSPEYVFECIQVDFLNDLLRVVGSKSINTIAKEISMNEQTLKQILERRRNITLFQMAEIVADLNLDIKIELKRKVDT